MLTSRARLAQHVCPAIMHACLEITVSTHTSAKCADGCRVLHLGASCTADLLTTLGCLHPGGAHDEARVYGNSFGLHTPITGLSLEADPAAEGACRNHQQRCHASQSCQHSTPAAYSMRTACQ
jgi:hypothetical protein